MRRLKRYANFPSRLTSRASPESRPGPCNSLIATDEDSYRSTCNLHERGRRRQDQPLGPCVSAAFADWMRAADRRI
jgi:hypothetical protein